MLTCVVSGLMFVVFGLWFGSGRAMHLAPGWSRMSGEERAEIKLIPLCRNVGGAICLAGMILLLAGAFPTFREEGLRWAMLGWLALCVLDLIYISRSGRYVTSRQRGGK